MVSLHKAQEATKRTMAMEFQAEREALVHALRQEIRDERVLQAFSSVPRESFVPLDLQRYAYEDRPLPIGQGQTISQPLIVAMMLEALALQGDEKVLEVGTGSGYQAALLALLARQVITVERISELAAQAEQRLAALGFGNVTVHLAGDELGWPAEAPYDAIAVTAGAPVIPRSLLDQLAPNGRMIIPVGARRIQQLVRVTKTERGVTLERMGECRFVPLIAAKEGWPEWELMQNGARPA